jgi:flagellar basal body-associated protein FliL
MAVIALIAVVGGLGTGLAASLSMQDLERKDAAEGAPTDPAASVRATWKPPELVVNLNEPGGARLLRAKLAFEGVATATDRCEQLRPRIQDDFIRLISDRAYADIEGSAGKDRLRADLLVHVNAIIAPEQVDQAFFDAFLVQ